MSVKIIANFPIENLPSDLLANEISCCVRSDANWLREE